MNENTERCVLCLEDKRSPVHIKCGHSFCSECFDVYKSYRKFAWAHRCPLCRCTLKERTRLVKRLNRRMLLSAERMRAQARADRHNLSDAARMASDTSLAAVSAMSAVTAMSAATSSSAAVALRDFILQSTIQGTPEASATRIFEGILVVGQPNPTIGPPQETMATDTVTDTATATDTTTDTAPDTAPATAPDSPTEMITDTASDTVTATAEPMIEEYVQEDVFRMRTGRTDDTEQVDNSNNNDHEGEPAQGQNDDNNEEDVGEEFENDQDDEEDDDDDDEEDEDYEDEAEEDGEGEDEEEEYSEDEYDDGEEAETETDFEDDDEDYDYEYEQSPADPVVSQQFFTLPNTDYVLAITGPFPVAGYTGIQPTDAIQILPVTTTSSGESVEVAAAPAVYPEDQPADD